MKYFLIAGEKSGDLHGGNLIRSIKKEDIDTSFTFFGGDEMSKASGVQPLVHIDQLAMMGFIEVLKHYPKIKAYLKQCKEAINNEKPDALILIDYAGFNLKVAEYAHNIGIKVHYYISPKLWAWRQKRAYKIKKYVDHMYCILPFEVDFYKKFDFEADYIGNPIMDEIEKFHPSTEFHSKHKLDNNTPIIALLPGSRKHEIQNILSLLSEITPGFPNYQFVIAGVSQFDQDFYKQFLDGQNLPVIFDQTYDLLSHSESAIVTSGTATLETALLNIPQVVVYKISKISYWIYKAFIKVKYVSLANLVVNKGVAVELLQNDFTAKNLKTELKAILKKGSRRDTVLKGNKEIINKVGTAGASKKAAKLIFSRIS